MPQPFARTDLVWDGDVNPQGIGTTYKAPLANGGSFRANALAFLVDESAGGPDSRMFGGQLGYASPSDRTWAFDAHRSEEHTSELQSLMRISYAVFCLKKKKKTNTTNKSHNDKNTSINNTL